MSMTDKDKEKFETLWKKLKDIRVKEYEDIMEYLKDANPSRLGKLDIIVTQLENRIASLERFVYFIILALGGEGWYTPELRETAKRLGLSELIEEGLI